MNNKELESYYDNFIDLFSLPGWKQLQEQLEATEANLNQIRTIKDHRDLDFRQGQMDVLVTLLSFEASIRQTIEALGAEESSNAV